VEENEQPYRRLLFTVRLFPEEMDADRMKLRGLVHVAQSGERCVFHNWPDLIDFFEAKVKEYMTQETENYREQDTD
jgi:hypothetical protein